MALLRNLEHSLGGLLEGTVGRVFRTAVRPTEIARKLAREMEINKRVSLSRTYAPTDYLVYLSPDDRARYVGVEDSIAEELGAYLLEHARRERLVLVRRPLVQFRTDPRLRLGEFGIEARTAPVTVDEAPPRPAPDRPRSADAGVAGAEAGRRLEPVPAWEDEDRDAAPAASDDDDPAFAPLEPRAELEPEWEPAPEPEPQPASEESAAADWLDPVDDWESRGPSPSAPAPYRPSAPAATGGAPGAPWIDPGLRTNPRAAAGPDRAAERVPTLTVVLDGRAYPLQGDRVVVGRSRRCDVIVADASVSREHLELRRAGAGWVAADLGSTNGTTLDGEPLSAQQPLAPGMRLRVGHAPSILEIR